VDGAEFDVTDDQFERLLSVLTGIRDALTPHSVDPDATPECEHPEELRVSLSSMTEIRWVCQRCRFEYAAPRSAAATAILTAK
jgi:hypothetical protein